MDSRKSVEPFARNDGGIVLLMGAGASAYLGLPTLDTILDNKVSSGSSEQAKLIWKTRSAVKAASKVGKAVFEEVIGKLREYENMAGKLRSEYPFREELGQLPYDVNTGVFECKWKSALTECYRILLGGCGPQQVDTSCPEFEKTIELFKRLAELNSGFLHLYTTNYDCSLQVISFNDETLSFFTQINPERGCFDGCWHRVGQKKSRYKIYVHRLHGCIAWFYDEMCPYFIREMSGAGKELDIKDDEKLHRMAIKLVTSQLVGINPAFLLSFSQFADSLCFANALVVWGYSFRDAEVLRTINSSFWQRQTPFPIYSLNPFLSESEITDNIHWTLRDVPVKLHKEFSPGKIAWKPSDGHQALIDKTIAAINLEIEPKCPKKKKQSAEKRKKPKK